MRDSSATEISSKIENSPVASLHMQHFTKRITKALIRLRVCACLPAPMRKPRRQVPRIGTIELGL